MKTTVKLFGLTAAVAVMGLMLAGCPDNTTENTGGGDPTVSTVTVNGNSSVEKGGTANYTATVTGTNNPAQTVTWSIEQADKNAGTTIDSSGKLTVAAAETLESLTVKATSTVDASKSGTKTVSVFAQGQAPTVNTVTVNPQAASVAKGGTQNFSASVTGTNNPAQTVTWSIEQANKNAGTTIDANGKLTVAAAETLASLTVKATSTVDTSKSGTASVTVTVTAPVDIPNPFTSIEDFKACLDDLPANTAGTAYEFVLEIDDLSGSSDTAGSLGAALFANRYSAKYVSLDLSGCTFDNNTIPSSAFWNCTGLTSVTIPASVTYINSSAFSYCTDLTSVTIGNSVTTIDGGAFSYCTGLTEFTVSPDNQTYASEGGILYNKAVTEIVLVPLGISGSVTIPDSVTSIGNAFRGCTSLTSVTIGNSVTTISSNTFSGCTGLTEYIVDPNNQNYSSEGGIIYNKAKTEVIKAPQAISGSVTIPDSVTSIGTNAFNGCTGLTSVTIGNGVTSINDSAFAYCTGLTSVTIPNSVTTISSSAFNGCTNLTSVTIGSGLNSFTSLPSSVTSITIDPDNPNLASENNIVYNKNKTTIVWVPKGISGSFTIPDSVTSIGTNAFTGCTGLTSIDIPDSVTSIGTFAFYNCTGLTSITIPDSVTTIGQQAFDGCTGLTSIDIPDSVTSIGKYTFRNCTRLESITIPFVGDTLNGTRNTYFGYIFGADSYMGQNSSIPASLKTVIITGESIPNNAFYGCTGLTSVTIPNSVESIGNSAFSGCTGLTSIDIPAGVTSIGQSAFSGCTGLTSIDIPNSVMYIGDRAFYGCTGLTSVTVRRGTPPTLGNVDAFANTNNCPIYVPVGSTYWSANVWKDIKPSSRFQSIQ